MSGQPIPKPVRERKRRAWNSSLPAPTERLKRGEPMERSGRVNPVSKRRAKENRQRAKLRPDVLARGCQVCPVLVQRVPDWERCNGAAVDWHEVVTRGRGGSITDPTNGLATCRRAHDWIGAHPVHAEAYGLLAKNVPAAGLLTEQDQGGKK